MSLRWLDQSKLINNTVFCKFNAHFKTRYVVDMKLLRFGEHGQETSRYYLITTGDIRDLSRYWWYSRGNMNPDSLRRIAQQDSTPSLKLPQTNV